MFGPPPLLLGLIALPTNSWQLFSASGIGLLSGLILAASGWAPRAGLALAFVSIFFFFPPVLQHPDVRKKANLIPVVLALLLVAPAQALLLVQLLLALVYLSAATEKLRNAGWRWMDGRSLRTSLLEHHLYTDDPRALWLAQRHQLCRWLSTGILLWEISFWLVLPFPALAWFYVPAGLAVHAGIAVTMRIHYWIYFCPAYFVFISPWICRHI